MPPLLKCTPYTDRQEVHVCLEDKVFCMEDGGWQLPSVSGSEAKVSPELKGFATPFVSGGLVTNWQVIKTTLSRCQYEASHRADLSQKDVRSGMSIIHICNQG